MMKIKALQKSYDEAMETTNKKRGDITQFATFRIRPEDRNPRHMEDFNKVLQLAAQGEREHR